MEGLEADDLDYGRWRLFLYSRLVGLVFLALISFTPLFGINPRMGWFIIVVVLPVNQAGIVLLRRTGRAPWLTPTFDALLMSAAIMIDPVISPVAGLILMGSSTQAAMVGWKRTTAAGLVGLPFVAFALIRVAPESAAVLIAAYLVTSASVTVFVSMISESEKLERRDRDQMLHGLDAIVWQADPYPFVQVDLRGRTMDILGLTADELSMPGAWLARLPKADRARISGTSRAAIARGVDHELNYRVISATGEIRHVRDRVRVETDESGLPIRSHGVIVDITDEVSAREVNRNLAELVERVPVGLLVTKYDPDSGDFVIVTVNPSLESIVGHTAVELLNVSVTDVVGGPGRVELIDLMNQTVADGFGGRVEELSDLVPGRNRVFALESFLISDDLVGLSITDITQAVEASKAIRHRALHDVLTNLPNRALFEDRLEHALDSSHRTGSTVALLVIDLDQFKEINDTFGHAHGDQLLIEVSSRLGAALRACDTVARLGGDEFAILLSEDVTRRSAMSAAERVIDCFDHPIDLAGVSVKCGASIGVAFHPEDAGETMSLQQRADAAMYVAKERGGGIAFYDHDQGHQHHDRLGLVGELSRAIDDEQLVVHYQPLVNLQTGQVDRVEALVRWNHPTRGLVSPANFIDVAEVSGVIRPLTRFVMRRAVNDVSDFRRAGHDIGLALNISVRNLYEPSFVSSVESSLAAAQLPGENVTLEITETQVMDDPILAHDVLGRLGALGVRGSVDDFGTGHSSLSNLQSLPLNEIKIDRSFVLGMAEGDASSATIVKSIVALGHNLGLDVVAEGIESEQMLGRLKDLTCDRAQGFHLAHPMSRAQLSTFLDSHRVKARP